MLPIADFTPLTPGAQITIVSLLAVLLIILNILAHLRRKPPLDSELVKLNIAVERLQASVTTLETTFSEFASHAVKIEDLQGKVRTLEEHREKDQHTQRAYTRESTQRIFDRLDELKDSLNANLQSVERAMGQLEGKVESLRSN